MNEQSRKEQLLEWFDFIDEVEQCDQVTNAFVQYRIMRALETIAKELNDISEKR